MIFKSFLCGFIAYVFAVIYNLLQGRSLEIVFFNGIKFLFTISLLALVFQLIISYFISDPVPEAETESEPENDSKNEKEASNNADQANQSNQANFENPANENIMAENTAADQFDEDFSPFDPPEIEYEQQNE